MLDQLTRAFYEIHLELCFRKKRGNEFQDFFSQMMELRFPSDFVRTRPWGNQGDRKNDGYHRSGRRLFQVYAPNELSAADAIKKIDEDFAEALRHWRQYFTRWTFVHNSMDGLGPQVLARLLELQQVHTSFTHDHFGYPEFRTETFSLSSADLAILLGNAPTLTNFTQLGFDKLRVVLLAVAQGQPTLDPEIRPVPKDKLKNNNLSSNAELLLRAGMSKSDLVSTFFKRWTDPTLGDSIAQAFSDKYIVLKTAGLSPDQIFQELHTFAGGGTRQGADHEAAVLAVLAHFFEECDIFERITGDLP